LNWGNKSTINQEGEEKVENCACGSERTYEECCEPFIRGDRFPDTAEQLMRSRYTAFTKAEVKYILDTVHPEKRSRHDEKAIRKWAEKSEWRGLEIIETSGGGPEDSEGKVEFIARYYQNGTRETHHEIAGFKKEEERWYFLDGTAPEQKQFVRSGPKVGRNDPCPCGSGKKYKKCCGR
jgi:SEC-C motif-containing protein